jgi:hypothetical protein
MNLKVGIENNVEGLSIAWALDRPAKIGSKQAARVYGEFWSPRKMLRRAVWHERDHTFHTNKLIGH